MLNDCSVMSVEQGSGELECMARSHDRKLKKKEEEEAKGGKNGNYVPNWARDALASAPDHQTFDVGISPEQ